MTDRAAQFRALYRELRIADQRKYYEARGKEYADAQRQAIAVRNTLLVLSAVLGVIGQFTAGAGRAACGVVAALLAALAGAMTAFEALIGFAQLRKVYADASLGLAAAEIDWDAAGPDADVAAEVERIERIFRVENGQWGQLVAEGSRKDTAKTGGDEPVAVDGGDRDTATR
jgi:hypothetical protein